MLLHACSGCKMKKPLVASLLVGLALLSLLLIATEWSYEDIVQDMTIDPDDAVYEGPPLDPLRQDAVEHYKWLQERTERQLKSLAGVSSPVDLCGGKGGGGCFEGSVIFLHQGRCGSTVLLKQLGWGKDPSDMAFPDIPTPEALRRITPFPDSAGLTSAELYQRYATDEELAFHMENMREQLSRFKYDESAHTGMIVSFKLYQAVTGKLRIHDWLTAMAGLGFKHLVVLHRNYLRVAVSGQLAKRTRIENRNCEAAENNMLQFPFAEKVKPWVRADKGYQDALAHPAFPNRLYISYENDVYDDPKVAARMIDEYLGRKREQPNVYLERTTDCPLDTLIGNMEDGIEVFGETTFRYALELDGKEKKLPKVPDLVQMCHVPERRDVPDYLSCRHPHEDDGTDVPGAL